MIGTAVIEADEEPADTCDVLTGLAAGVLPAHPESAANARRAPISLLRRISR